MRLAPRTTFAIAIFLTLSAVCADRPARAQGARAPAASATAAQPASPLRQAVAALSDWARPRGGQAGVAVIDIQTGQLLAGVRQEIAVNPASNAKLLTAAAALAELGPDFHYTTALHGRLRDGNVADLVLRGHGDPSLTVADLMGMCRSLVGLGLKRVRGKILVDQSRFDAEVVPPAFGQQPDEWASFRAPVSAVAIERNAVTLNVAPTRAGSRARYWFHPPGAVDVSGSIATHAAGSGQAVQLSLAVDGDRLRATLGGHLAEGLPRLRFSRRLDDPRLVPGRVLRRLLLDVGVEVAGGVALGGEQVRHRLVFHRSASLAVLLRELGKNSDNFYAEMIFKTLGAESRGAPAKSSDGARAVSGWLERVGAAGAGTVIRNGSGLFDANRTSPLTLASALRAAYRDPALSAEFVSQLAVGGVDGTLRSRFRAHRQSRRVRAKTGTLATVDALGGYALDASGSRPVAFSMVITGIRDHHQVRRRMDRVVEEILKSTN